MSPDVTAPSSKKSVTHEVTKGTSAKPQKTTKKPSPSTKVTKRLTSITTGMPNRNITKVQKSTTPKLPTSVNSTTKIHTTTSRPSTLPSSKTTILIKTSLSSDRTTSLKVTERPDQKVTIQQKHKESVSTPKSTKPSTTRKPESSTKLEEDRTTHAPVTKPKSYSSTTRNVEEILTTKTLLSTTSPLPVTSVHSRKIETTSQITTTPEYYDVRVEVAFDNSTLNQTEVTSSSRKQQQQQITTTPSSPTTVYSSIAELITNSTVSEKPHSTTTKLPKSTITPHQKTKYTIHKEEYSHSSKILDNKMSKSSKWIISTNKPNNKAITFSQNVSTSLHPIGTSKQSTTLKPTTNQQRTRAATPESSSTLPSMVPDLMGQTFETREIPSTTQRSTSINSKTTNQPDRTSITITNQQHSRMVSDHASSAQPTPPAPIVESTAREHTTRGPPAATPPNWEILPPAPLPDETGGYGPIIRNPEPTSWQHNKQSATRGTLAPPPPARPWGWPSSTRRPYIIIVKSTTPRYLVRNTTPTPWIIVRSTSPRGNQ